MSAAGKKISWQFSSIIDRRSAIIASTTIAGDLLGSLFGFYYIKVFLTIYYLNNYWLNLVQILFAVWNAINDPLFGCAQDVGCNFLPRWLTNRRKVILYFGPIYAASFMLFWIPWTIDSPDWLVGLHLLVSLFVFDSLVSLVLSAQCGLFTESTTQHRGRVRMIVYLEMASLLAGFVILPVDFLSKSLSNFRTFQICAGVVAALACLFFLITGFFASDHVAQVTEQKQQHTDSSDQLETTKREQLTDGGIRESWKAVKSILSDRDFWCVVGANFLHIMRITGDANFLAIFTEALISPHGILTVGSIELSLFYTGCTVLSKAFLVICWPLLHRFGAYTVLMMTLLLTAVNSVTTVLIGRFCVQWLAIYFIFENILAKGLWPAVYNIFFPDVIDEDMIRHKRKTPLSTLTFTLNALFTKPAISLAPVLIVAALNRAGYADFLQWQKLCSNNKNSNGTSAALFSMPVSTTNLNTTVSREHIQNCHNPNSMPDAQFDYLYSNMFYVACLYPLACAFLEAACLVPFRLKFRHKRDQNVQPTSTCDSENKTVPADVDVAVQTTSTV